VAIATLCKLPLTLLHVYPAPLESGAEEKGREEEVVLGF